MTEHKIPEDLQTKCVLCAGVGHKERTSFVDASTVRMGSCHACKGTGKVWALDQQEMAERIAALTAERDQLKDNPARLLQDGIPVVLAEEFDALKAERDGIRDAFDDYKGRLWCALGQPLEIEYIEAVKQLRAALARMQGPVTDAEWLVLCAGFQVNEHVVTRDDVDALLAARAGEGNDGRN